MAKEVKKLNKIVAKSPDQAKAQNAAKLKKTVIESGNKSGKLAGPKDIKKAFPESGKPSNVEKVVNRAKTTAREARDVVTAVGTVAKRPGAKSVKNAVKQVAETAKAATTGKKGTTSDYVGQAKGLGLLAQGGESSKFYRKGSKR